MIGVIASLIGVIGGTLASLIPVDTPAIALALPHDLPHLHPLAPSARTARAHQPAKTVAMRSNPYLWEEAPW